ncbi:uncharacterized protein VTP21DRAFT_3277 [Calcarisporiella thermophila]|uniref:uncharacterized protein n=1 Tax=Calcarisporiella thermophila TaxID=911321 RepID=UPI00374305CC
MATRWGGAPKCPRCHQAVYLAEQAIGPQGVWHKKCLTCKECGRKLDSTILTEHQGEAYCNACYKRNWGPKGFGFNNGAAFLSTTYVKASPDDSSPARESAGSDAQFSSATPTPTSSVAESPVTSPVRQTSLSSPVKTSFFSRQPVAARKLNFGSTGDICPSCGKAVYAAESVLGAGGIKYHKLCLKCSSCGRVVDATTMVDRENKTIFCRRCYSREYGPKGYGYGGGAGFLSPDGRV